MCTSGAQQYITCTPVQYEYSYVLLVVLNVLSSFSKLSLSYAYLYSYTINSTAIGSQVYTHPYLWPKGGTRIAFETTAGDTV